MFYNLELLCRRRNGRFATIWLAANRGIMNVPKSDILSVDIVATCEQLMKYISSKSTTPSKRFSLYLSIKLVYGTVLVYERQLRHFQEQMFTFFTTIKRPLPINDRKQGKKRGKYKSVAKRKSEAQAGEPRLEVEPLDEHELNRLLHEPVTTTVELGHISLPEVVPPPRPLSPNNFSSLIPNTALGNEGAAQVPCTSATELESLTSEFRCLNLRKRRAEQPLVGSQAKRARTEDQAGTGAPVEAEETRLLKTATSSLTVETVPCADAAQARTEGAPQTPQSARPPRPRRRPVVHANDDNFIQDPKVIARITSKANYQEVPFRLPAKPASDSTLTLNEIKEILERIKGVESIQLRHEATQDTLVDSALGALQLTSPNLTASKTLRPVEPEVLPCDISTPHLSRIEAPQESSLQPEGEIAVPDVLLPKPTAINEVSPRSSRIHTSTPVPFSAETRRQTRLLRILRDKFQINDEAPLTLQDICFPLNRYKVATTFHDLIYLKSKEYVLLESFPDSLELQYIKPGMKLWSDAMNY